jgi:aspartate aminotransferase
MQTALPGLMKIKPDWKPIIARRERVFRAFKGTGLRWVPGEASFFLYVRTPTADDFAFAEALAAQNVLVLPAAVFHDVGHFRISLTGSDEMLDRALPIIVDVASQFGGREDRA